MSIRRERVRPSVVLAVAAMVLPLSAGLALAAKPIVGSWDLEGFQIGEASLDGVTMYGGNELLFTIAFNADKTFMTEGTAGKWVKDGGTYTADFAKALKTDLKQSGATDVTVAKAAFFKIEVVPATAIQGKLAMKFSYKAKGLKAKQKLLGVFTGVPSP